MTGPSQVLGRLTRRLIDHLPIPIAKPIELRRAPIPPEARPLLAHRVSLLGLEEGPAATLAQALEHVGASVCIGPPATDLDIVLFAATEPGGYDTVLRLHHVLHDAVGTLRSHGKLIIVLPADSQVLSGAVHGFVRSLARELGGRGITVNAIEASDLMSAVPVIVFLASDRASFITAQTLHVRAGGSMREPEVKPCVAVVTGAARGIGAACARHLAAAGYRVALVDVPTQQAAASRLCEQLGGEAAGMEVLACDVLDGEAVEAAFERARMLSPRGAIDVLVNNAGITRDRTFRRMTSDEWDAVLHVNLRALIEVTRRARPRLAPGARIVNVASVTGFAGNFGQTNYAAAKGGVIGFTRDAARELEPMGLCVTAVAPGLIETSMTATIPRFNREVAKQMTSLAQTGLPDDVAAAVEFLARREAWSLRGEVLRVDGGMFFGA